MFSIDFIVLVNLMVVIINVGILALNAKLYTEILKDKGIGDKMRDKIYGTEEE